MIVTFNNLGLDLKLIEGLAKANIKAPTDIQAKTIPLALENKDIIGQSQTGSGKTLAYLLPIFQRIDTTQRHTQALILAPTHELVMQIESEIKLLALNSEIDVTSAAIIGEVNVKRQIEKLREKPHIIVGSTGRIHELIKNKKINSQTIKTIVIDEGDRLLDHDNLASVKSVIKTTMRDRQLMVFSATISEKALETAKNLMKEPQAITIESETPVSETIDHMYFISDQRDKIELLRKLIASINPEKAIIFINRSDDIQITTGKLQYHHISAYGIYGGADKEERKKALEGFRSGKYQLLVASDLAARGLDIQDVTHIINLDLPPDAKEFLHRAGRTGRVGKTGTTITIVTEQEKQLLSSYEKMFKIKFQPKKIYKGKILNLYQEE